MPTKELVARCLECDHIVKGELTWDDTDRSIRIDYTSPLIQSIGAHHWKFPRGSNHGAVLLFFTEEDAKRTPVEETEKTRILDRFPAAIGTLTVARTSSQTVYNTACSFGKKIA